MKDNTQSNSKPGKVKIFTVTLADPMGRAKGKPYRTLAVPSSWSLYRFAEFIIASFSFDFDHCFGFFDNLKNIYRSQEAYELFKDIGEDTNSGSVKTNKLDKVFHPIGKKMCFMFDYGDDWRFLVELKDEMEVPAIKEYPKLLESKGKAPEQYPDYDEES